jgi:ubiquinone/menaquinone biosynthesis C-methylase UbiE
MDIGNGNNGYAKKIHSSNIYYSLDYPATNERYQSRPQVYAVARSLHVGDDEMDAVFLFEVLEHIPDTKSVLQEIRRVLEPCGEFNFFVLYLSYT